MWPSWKKKRNDILVGLRGHSHNVRMLPGIRNNSALQTLATQFVASLRREEYYKLVQRKAVSERRANPNDEMFDAERAVAYHMQQGDIDEASWLIFLMTYFARPADSGWRRLQDVYGMLGSGIWTWSRVKIQPKYFFDWIEANRESVGGKFGSHRKYETLRRESNRGMENAVSSYLAWIGPSDHRKFFATAVLNSGNNPHVIFDSLYHSMTVKSFGRLAKFDYLSLIGRYNIAPIDAGLAYLNGATGPLRGARLLFDGRPDGRSSIYNLQRMLDTLDHDISVSMKVMEDALCNWQKSPEKFIHFKG